MIEVDIVVVGAGPVGLAAALITADAGYRVALVGPPAPADRRTSALLGGSITLLDRLGVWSQLKGASAPLRTMRIIDGTRRLIRAPEVAFDAGEIGADAFGHNVPNAAMTAAMEAAAAARGVTRVLMLADSVAIGETTITIAASHGETLVARLAIAADGRRSRLRDAAGIAVETWTYNQAALVCDLRHTAPHHDTSTEFHTEHGPLTLVPLGPGRSSLVWVDRPQASHRRLDLPEPALAEEIEDRTASIFGAITIDGPRQVFPLGGLTAQQFATARVMLAGEAAHLFPPIGAQGLNLGLRDVATLADVLSGPVPDPGADAILDAYHRARRPDVITRTIAVDALNRTLLTDFLPAQALRGLGLFLVDRVPPLRHQAMRRGLGA